MASLDSLPADQRAVLQLVLQRGRSYDEIAQMLSIDRAAVRERALSALDGLGPQTRVAPERRALITDYLLGQLPVRVSEDTRDRLAESPSERAWARVVASEVGSLSSGPLPEIPVEASRPEPAQPIAPEPAQQIAPEPAQPIAPEPTGAPEPAAPAAPHAAQSFRPEPSPSPAAAAPSPALRRSFRRRERPRPPKPPSPPGPPRSSRRGGIVVLALGVLVVVIIVVVIVASSGGNSSKPTASASSTATTTSTPAATSTATPTTAAKPIAQVNLVSPTGNKKTAGIAEVIRQGANTGLVVVAQGIPANTSHDAYAVWLYNSPSDTRILGFVNPGVKADGKLQTAGVLPADAAHFKQLLVTLETQAKPHGPGKIILEGALNITQ